MWQALGEVLEEAGLLRHHLPSLVKRVDDPRILLPESQAGGPSNIVRVSHDKPYGSDIEGLAIIWKVPKLATNLLMNFGSYKSWLCPFGK